jgi:DNA-binding transcriptional ArsR family regulator
MKSWNQVLYTQDSPNTPRCEMSLDLESASVEERYRVFEAISHPTRVEILKLVEEKELSFSALKRELGLQSSGQLQHHLQKLSGFVAIEKESGCYGLTKTGRLALEIYDSSEKSGRSLEALCCLPTRLDATEKARIGRTGSALRLSLAAVLLALTAALVASGQAALKFYGSSVSVGFGVSGAVIAGFFGVSFLISGFDGHPGCEIVAIPNLLARGKKFYCSCVIAPFNLPNGRFLQPLEKSETPKGAAITSSESG